MVTQPRVSFWTHPGTPGFSLVIYGRGVWLSTRGGGIFSHVLRPRYWPRDFRFEWARSA